MQSILLTNGFWRWVAAGQRGRKAQSLNCWSSQMWLRATLCSGCQPGAVLEAGQPRVWPRPAAARGEVSWDFVQTNSEKDFRGLIPPLSSLDGLLHGSTVLLHEKPSYLHLPRCISGCCSLLLEVCVSLCHSRTAPSAIAVVKAEAAAELYLWQSPSRPPAQLWGVVDVAAALITQQCLCCAQHWSRNFSRGQVVMPRAVLETKALYLLAFSWPQRGHSPNSITNGAEARCDWSLWTPNVPPRVSLKFRLFLLFFLTEDLREYFFHSDFQQCGNKRVLSRFYVRVAKMRGSKAVLSREFCCHLNISQVSESKTACLHWYWEAEAK